MKPMSKPALWATSLRAVDEGEELLGDLGEDRLVGQVVVADAVHGLRLGMDRAALRD